MLGGFNIAKNLFITTKYLSSGTDAGLGENKSKSRIKEHPSYALFQTAFQQVLERLIKSITKDSEQFCWGRLQHLDAQRITKKIKNKTYRHVSGYDEYIKDVEWVIKQYDRTVGLGPKVN